MIYHLGEEPLPKEIVKSDLKNYCYKIINEKPLAEYYYKSYFDVDYDGVELIYYCETPNKIKYNITMNSSVPEKYIDIFKKISSSVEIR